MNVLCIKVKKMYVYVSPLVSAIRRNTLENAGISNIHEDPI